MDLARFYGLFTVHNSRFLYVEAIQADLPVTLAHEVGVAARRDAEVIRVVRLEQS